MNTLWRAIMEKLKRKLGLKSRPNLFKQFFEYSHGMLNMTQASCVIFLTKNKQVRNFLSFELYILIIRKCME